jgi:hypothetical protein
MSANAFLSVYVIATLVFALATVLSPRMLQLIAAHAMARADAIRAAQKAKREGLVRWQERFALERE